MFLDRDGASHHRDVKLLRSKSGSAAGVVYFCVGACHASLAYMQPEHCCHLSQPSFGPGPTPSPGPGRSPSSQSPSPPVFAAPGGWPPPQHSLAGAQSPKPFFTSQVTASTAPARKAQKPRKPVAVSTAEAAHVWGDGMRRAAPSAFARLVAAPVTAAMRPARLKSDDDCSSLRWEGAVRKASRV